MVPEKTIFGLLGPNGGKPTVLQLVTGVYDFEGEIKFGGISVAGKKPSQIAHLGIARTFQNIRLFQSMTVIEKRARRLRELAQGPCGPRSALAALLQRRRPRFASRRCACSRFSSWTRWRTISRPPSLTATSADSRSRAR